MCELNSLKATSSSYSSKLPCLSWASVWAPCPGLFHSGPSEVSVPCTCCGDAQSPCPCAWLLCSFCARQPRWGELLMAAPVSGVLSLKCVICLEGPYCLQIWALCSTEHFPGVLGARANLAENGLLESNSSSSKVWTARKA